MNLLYYSIDISVLISVVLLSMVR